ncbi:MAG: diguanylate cyclase [Candidatus Dormibacteraeota bacterium]|nr:diguanylate cyclase [Candidatus Dormibacteraeota bacterium]
MTSQSSAPRRARRASFSFQFALMLVGVWLATALAVGGVAWYETQHARSQQMLQSGSGAARLGISLVRMETATASADFACELAGLAPTAAGFTGGGQALAALAKADTATVHGQELLFVDGSGLVGSPVPATSIPGVAGLAAVARAAPASCASGRGSGFFAAAAGTIYGVGVAPVAEGGHPLGLVVVLTPVSTATLNFAAGLLGSSWPNSTVLLAVGGQASLAGQLGALRQPAGAPLPVAVRSILHSRQQVGDATLAGVQYTVAGQGLTDDQGSPVATLVVVQSSVLVGPSAVELAIPLALAVTAVLLLGMVLLLLLTERYLNRPLRRLNQAVQRLGQNAYADPVNIDGAEEVTRLAANFEIMRRQLRRQLLLATGRTVIASTLTGNVPLEQALAQVLASLMNLLEADMAMILLPPQPPSGQGFLITNGVPGPALEWAELEASNGILGQLVRSPQFLSRSHLAPDDRGALESRIGLRDCLAEPLKGPAQDLGVLIVANHRRPYREEDRALCKTVADQVVAAVAKSLQLAATQREATTDAMTGLYNYRFLISYLDQQVNVAERANTPLSVLMLDLDHFKVINDSFGHPVGDRVLRAVAAQMLDTIRKSDLAARYGGEEFVVVMSNTSSEDAAVVAEKIRVAVEGLTVALEDGGAVRLTVSLGGVTFPEGTKGARNLLDLADRALYAAKRGGRNRVEFLDPKGVAESTSRG